MGRRFPAIALSLVLAGSAMLAACGDDEVADDPAPAERSADDQSADDAPAGNGPTGSGTLTVGGETYQFEVIFCGFGPEETGNPDNLFTLVGRGADDLELQASTVEVDVIGKVDSISLYQGDPRSTELNWQSMHGTGGVTDNEYLEIDGNRVTATAAFADETDPEGTPEDALDTVEGTLEATCP